MSGRVLVADDEADIRDLVALTLEIAGYDVETARRRFRGFGRRRRTRSCWT